MDANQSIGRRPMISRRQGFTLVELLVVVAIVSLLVALLLPSLAKAREQAKTTRCLASIKNCDLVLLLYAQENEGYLPFASQGNPAATTTPEWIRYFCSFDNGGNPNSAGMGIAWNTLTCPSYSYGLELTRPFPAPSNTVNGFGLRDSTSANNRQRFYHPSNYPTQEFFLYTDYAINASGATLGSGPSAYVFRSGSARNDSGAPYDTTSRYPSLRAIQRPADILSFSESQGLWLGSGNGPGFGLMIRHNNLTAINVSFFDGHAETFTLWSASPQFVPFIAPSTGSENYMKLFGNNNTSYGYAYRPWSEAK